MWFCKIACRMRFCKEHTESRKKKKSEPVERKKNISHTIKQKKNEMLEGEKCKYLNIAKLHKYL